MRVLDVSCANHVQQSGIFQGAEVDYAWVDRQGIVYYTHDVGPYDVVVLGHSLPASERELVIPMLKELVEETMRPGAALHAMAPSLEFAAREILANRIDPAMMVHIYGEEQRPMRHGYTLEMLRGVIEEVGLVVLKAVTMPYPMAEVDGKPVMGDMHYVVAAKPSQELVKSWVA